MPQSLVSANTKTNGEHGWLGWTETHCAEHNPTKPELRALHQLSVGLSHLWIPVHKLRHKLCPAAPMSPQHTLGRGSSPIPPGNLQLHKTSTKMLKGETGAAVLSRANEHESVPSSHRETNSCEFRQTQPNIKQSWSQEPAKKNELQLSAYCRPARQKDVYFSSGIRVCISSTYGQTEPSVAKSQKF